MYYSEPTKMIYMMTLYLSQLLKLTLGNGEKPTDVQNE